MVNDPKVFDDLFDQAEQQISLDEWIVGKESVFEERMVKYVMARVGLANQIGTLKTAGQEWTGDPNTKLTFNWFHEQYPTFPVRLCVKSYVKAHENTIPDLFKRFTNTRMYKAFMEAKETIPDGERFASWALIFPWTGLGQAVAHNNRQLEIQGTRVVRQFGNGEIVYLDILIPFLEAVSKTWSP